MRWIKNGFTEERGNLMGLIAKFDTSDYWFTYQAMTWTGEQIKIFRRIGKILGANNVEVKPYWNEVKNEPAESYLITIIEFYDGTVKFRHEFELRNDRKRRFKYFTVEELLKKGE